MPEDVTVEDVGAAAHRVVEARPQGRRDLPRQLQGRPAPRHGQEGSGRQRLRHRRARWLRRSRRWTPRWPRRSPSSSRRSSATSIFTKQPVRERMPNKRRSTTTKFRVADCEGYFTVGEYDDGRPGRSVHLGVQAGLDAQRDHGRLRRVDLARPAARCAAVSTYVKKYSNSRFEPSGMTEDPELRIATSLMDYIFRRIAVDYMPLRRARRARHPHPAGAHRADPAR